MLAVLLNMADLMTFEALAAIWTWTILEIVAFLFTSKVLSLQAGRRYMTFCLAFLARPLLDWCVRAFARFMTFLITIIIHDSW